MSEKLVRWLLGVVALEVVAMCGLVVWAKTMRPAHQTTTITSTAGKPAPAKLNPPQITPVLYASGVPELTDIASTPISTDKRLFAAERSGVVRLVQADGKLAPQPFLDIQSKVHDDKGEMGLLGLAFHPKFAQNNYFFVDYIDTSQNTVVARFTVSKQTGLADPSSERILFTLKQPYPNHNGGGLHFGPDGYLYISLGDGGSSGDPQNRAQDKTSYFGKLLRIDVDRGDPYAIPASNPFAKDTSAKPEIWAYGLRNPWRFSFDRQTGDLYIADVGQEKIEEVDFRKAGDEGGENYGWRCYEGTQAYNTTAGCQSADHYTSPVLTYTHDQKRCSITGGYVYRGVKYPAMVGKYFFGDYCGGQIYYTSAAAAGAWKVAEGAATPYGISTFGQGSDGELYVGDIVSGTIYHLTDTANK